MLTNRAAALRVLVIDAESATRRVVCAGLVGQGYRVSTANTGYGALKEVRNGATDMVVLELGLPDIDGLDVIAHIRSDGATLPIIVLSSSSNAHSKVMALDLGADDYLTKPASIDEFLARVRVAQRHQVARKGNMPVFRAGDLTVDLMRRIVSVRGEQMRFSRLEYDLLRLLVSHAGTVLPHDFILREVWGPGVDVQYLRIYIRALRRKIERDPGRPIHIQTENGLGYRLRAAD
jgi:two-component system, OmpR family, KDP operon response regulator KdpE